MAYPTSVRAHQTDVANVKMQTLGTRGIFQSKVATVAASLLTETGTPH